MIDVYKYLNGLSSHIMNDIFGLIGNTYNPINFHLFGNQNPRTKQYGLECTAYRASQVGKLFPLKSRDSISLKNF